MADKKRRRNRSSGGTGKKGGSAPSTSGPDPSNSDRKDALKAHDKMMAKSAHMSDNHFDGDGKLDQPGKELVLPGMYGEHREPEQKILKSMMDAEFKDQQAEKDRQGILADVEQTSSAAQALGPNKAMPALYGAHRSKTQRGNRHAMHKELRKEGKGTRRGLDAEARERRENVAEAQAPAQQEHGMDPAFWDLLSDERKQEYTALQAGARESYTGGQKVGGQAKVGFYQGEEGGHAIKQGKSGDFMEREVAVAQISREMGLEAVGQSAMLQTGGGDRVASPLHQGNSVQNIIDKTDISTAEGKADMDRLAHADVDDVQQIVINDLIFNNKDGHYGQYMLLDDGHMVKIDQEALGASGGDMVQTTGMEPGAHGFDEVAQAEEKALAGESDDVASASSFAAGLPSATAPLTANTRELIASWDQDAIENIAALMQAASYQNGESDDARPMFAESVRERTIANIEKVKAMVEADTEGVLSARDLFLEATKGTVEQTDGNGETTRVEREGVHPSMQKLEDETLADKDWIPEDLRGEKAFHTQASRFNAYGGFGKEFEGDQLGGGLVQLSEATRMDKDGFDLNTDHKKNANWAALEEEDKRQAGIHAQIAHEQKKANKKSKQLFRSKKSKTKQADKYAQRIADLQGSL